MTRNSNQGRSFSFSQFSLNPHLSPQDSFFSPATSNSNNNNNNDCCSSINDSPTTSLSHIIMSDYSKIFHNDNDDDAAYFSKGSSNVPVSSSSPATGPCQQSTDSSSLMLMMSSHMKDLESRQEALEKKLFGMELQRDISVSEEIACAMEKLAEEIKKHQLIVSDGVVQELYRIRKALENLQSNLKCENGVLASSVALASSSSSSTLAATNALDLNRMSMVSNSSSASSATSASFSLAPAAAGNNVKVSRFFPVGHQPVSGDGDSANAAKDNSSAGIIIGPISLGSNNYTTLYYDVGVYVPYSSLRKQLRRHGVPSSLILNMFYRRGGIVEIVTYSNSVEVLIADLDKLNSWTWVKEYDPIMGSLEMGSPVAKSVDASNAASVAPVAISRRDYLNGKISDLSVQDLHSTCQTYLTTVHSAILTSNGSDSLKAYYQDYGKLQCEKFVQDARRCVPVLDKFMREKGMASIELDAIWNASVCT